MAGSVVSASESAVMYYLLVWLVWYALHGMVEFGLTGSVGWLGVVCWV